MFHTFLFHWAIFLGGWTVVMLAYWVATRSDLAAGALLSAAVFCPVVALAAFCTRQPRGK